MQLERVLAPAEGLPGVLDSWTLFGHPDATVRVLHSLPPSAYPAFMTFAQQARWLLIGFALLLAPSAHAQTDDWEALRSLESGIRVVVHLESESVEGLFRRVSATRLFVVAALGQILEFDATEVRAVYQVVPGPLVRRMVIGSAITGGIMLYPCGVAPQANASAAGCRAGSFLLGAGFGLIYHFLNRDRLETVYVAKKEAATSSVRDWRGESVRALELLISSGRR